jgi:hypothetical protein
MNTITSIASTDTILAIDLGKHKSVACVHVQDTGEIRFTTLEVKELPVGISPPAVSTRSDLAMA